jgi:hypothetical protein
MTKPAAVRESQLFLAGFRQGMQASPAVTKAARQADREYIRWRLAHIAAMKVQGSEQTYGYQEGDT